jgi:glutamate-1-semialdehyde 2,1-aminomutase
MNNGAKLWNKAKDIIPGGNGLLSKRPDRYGKDIWPTYFTKAKGCLIWDLDNNVYIDMAQNGMGTSILGYADDDVNQSVINAINKGINTTLNATEEVDLAKKLLELNPSMAGVKFARGGGEAMSLAVRIARAHTKKDKVIFSGYHGWTDWYLATNISSESNLDEHLLPGLQPSGVPSGLSDTAIPFNYNDIDSFMNVLDSHSDTGVVVLEGARYSLPNIDFVKTIEVESQKRGIIVIVDEITSGLRMSKSGTYSLLNFNPDIVVYGKGLGNGFAISAVLGKKAVMDSAQDTFVSSSMWTERVGFVAALATLEKLSEHNVYQHLIDVGEFIGSEWLKLSQKHGLDISITEFKPLITFKLNYGSDNNAIATLFIQEMLKRGYLASTSVYVTYSHTIEIVKEYLINVDEVFELISKAIENHNISSLLETEIRTDMFKRLN